MDVDDTVGNPGIRAGGQAGMGSKTGLCGVEFEGALMD